MKDLRSNHTVDMKVNLRADRMVSNLANIMCEMLVGLVRDLSAGFRVGLRSIYSCNLGWFEGWLEG